MSNSLEDRIHLVVAKIKIFLQKKFWQKNLGQQKFGSNKTFSQSQNWKKPNL